CGGLRGVQPEVHAARPLRARPLGRPRAGLRPAGRAGARGHAGHGRAAMTETPEQPLPITPDMLLSRRVDFERRLRRAPTSALAGSLVSLLTSPGPSVGASGAIFGLQGAAIVLFRTHRDRLLLRDRRVGFVLLVWAIYTIVGGLLTPLIDNGAHLGGALGG